MTTIVFKDGVIAYDSQTTQDGVIKSLNHDKSRTRDGVRFFFAGSVGDYEKFMDSWFAGKSMWQDNPPGIAALVVDETGKVWDSSIGLENDFWRCELLHEDAYGSGANFALAAMDMGADAETAVRIAAGRDIYTGGKIQTFKVPV